MVSSKKDAFEMLMWWGKYTAVTVLLGYDDIELNEKVCLKYVHKALHYDGLRRMIMARKGWDELQVMTLYKAHEEKEALEEAEFRAECLKRPAEV